ncbi:hypothetical protein [Haloflavibacter putidus]|uniref:Adhesin domain-containing protein n=1 Tax=Haloflavibacter putidus TaxID=2576776 RepID=A0A507ZJR0_9FLAO|nr:hypothetical protein [Haloflavibacter putidus]TQD36921.1 hypothetical protein FKR84_09930 [Haloflavibacter putidus]
MKNLTVVLLVFFLYGNNCFAQRTKTTIISAKDISSVFVQADEVFKITINASKRKTIRYSVTAEGEYLQDIYIKNSIEGKELKLESHYNKLLLGGQDKLAAHKVFALNLEIDVPQNFKVVVLSNLASVYANGAFKYLETELKAGQCSLSNFTGKAFVVTYTGDVFVKTKQAEVEAKSNLGAVKIDPRVGFGNLIKVKSISGDIVVKKIE